MSVCEEEATEEAEEEKAAGAELKTKTPHNDVGNNLEKGSWPRFTLKSQIEQQHLEKGAWPAQA